MVAGIHQNETRQSIEQLEKSSARSEDVARPGSYNRQMSDTTKCHHPPPHEMPQRIREMWFGGPAGGGGELGCASSGLVHM